MKITVPSSVSSVVEKGKDWKEKAHGRDLARSRGVQDAGQQVQRGGSGRREGGRERVLPGELKARGRGRKEARGGRRGWLKTKAAGGLGPEEDS